MKRGEIWTLRDDGYASKARPVVIVQSDNIAEFNSIILCLLTTYESIHIPTRIHISADSVNGLKKDSYVMTEKIVTVDKNELGERIGMLTHSQQCLITTQLATILDIYKLS